VRYVVSRRPVEKARNRTRSRTLGCQHMLESHGRDVHVKAAWTTSKMTKITHKASNVMFTARMAQRQAFEPNACDEE
jgi:hypothetical protein